MADTRRAVMYRLINPDPLHQRTLRSIAQQACCSHETVRRLRTGELAEVGEPIARSIAHTCRQPFAAMFEPVRRAWER